MKKVVLERRESSDHGTFGRLYVEGEMFFTGELPWRGNRANISCIPAGIYYCYWTDSLAFRRKLYIVSKVSNRAGVRIHSANFMGDQEKGFLSQLRGCISLGEKLGFLDGQKALLLSMPAIRRFEKLMNYEPFELEIVDGYRTT